MEAFSALLALCERESIAIGPSKIPVTRSSEVFFDRAHEETVEQTTVTPVIWDVIVLIMTSL